MSHAIFDAESTVTLAAGNTATADTTYTPALVQAHLLPTSFVNINVSAMTTTGTYAFIVEASDVQAGPYSQVQRYDWPAGQGPRQVGIGINAHLVKSVLLT